MLESSTEILEYDGSYQGFLCCVYTIFKKQQLPQMIYSTEEIQETLFAGRYIETDEALAQRMHKRLKQRLTTENFEFIEQGFFATVMNKELCLMYGIELALTYGDSLERHVYMPEIAALHDGIRKLKFEVHYYEGFTRFSQVNDFLMALIEPKYYVLPYLLPHFVARYPNEHFGLFDQTHQLLAVVEKGNIVIEKVSEVPDFTLSENERQIQQQWRTFFKTVSIKERENPRAQMNHMPKRFWNQLTECSKATPELGNSNQKRLNKNTLA